MNSDPRFFEELFAAGPTPERTARPVCLLCRKPAGPIKGELRVMTSDRGEILAHQRCHQIATHNNI